MPNWCDNTLTLRHDNPEMIDRVVDSLKQEKFLSEFIPMPDELRKTNSPNSVNADEMLAKYGYSDWYSFCVSEWGTKWDFGSESVDREDDNTVSFYFESAWSPPIEAYKKLAKLGFTLEAYYHEPGLCFVGKVITDNSDIVNDYHDYSDETSETVREVIGEELDDYYAITESMQEFEDENEDD